MSTELKIRISADTKTAMNQIGAFASQIKRMFAQISSKGIWNVRGAGAQGTPQAAVQGVQQVTQAVNKARKAVEEADDETKSWLKTYQELIKAFKTAKASGAPIDKSVQESILKQASGLVRGVNIAHLKGKKIPDADQLPAAFAEVTELTTKQLNFSPFAQTLSKGLEETTKKYKDITKEIELIKRVSPGASQKLVELARAGQKELEKKAALVRQVVVQQVEGIKGIPLSGEGRGVLGQIEMQIRAMDKLIVANDTLAAAKAKSANLKGELERGTAHLAVLKNTDKAYVSQGDQILAIHKNTENYKKSVPGMIDQIAQITGKTREQIKALDLEAGGYKRLLKDAKAYYSFVEKHGHGPRGTTRTQDFLEHVEDQLGTRHGPHASKMLIKAKENLVGYGILPQEEVTKWQKVRDFAADIKKYAHFQIRWFASATSIFILAGGIAQAFRAALDFYQTLKNIQAVTHASAQSIQRISDAAIDVAKQTPLAADEAAKMGLKLIQAGLGAEEAAAGMQTVAAVATVSGEDMQGAIESVTTAMFAWKLDAQEIPRIGNAIAGALNYSRLTVIDLGTAFNYLASTSSIMNRSLEETVANMSVLSNMGLRASTIGTNLAQLYAQLISPSKKLREELHRIGLSVNDVNPSMHRLADIVKLLTERGFNANKAFEMLEDRAGRLLASALVATGEEFDNMEERIRNSTKLQESLKVAMEGPTNALKNLRNELGAIAIHISSVSVPAIQVFTTSIKGLLWPVSLAAEGFSIIAGKTGLWSVAMVAALPVLIGTNRVLSSMKKVADGLGKSVFSLATIFKWASLAKHPYILALVAVGAALAAVGAVFGSASRATKEYVSALKDGEDTKKRQIQLEKEAEAAAMAEEKAIARVRENWERAAKTEVRMPFINTIEILQTKLLKVSEQLNKIKNEMLSFDDVGTRASEFLAIEKGKDGQVSPLGQAMLLSGAEKQQAEKLKQQQLDFAREIHNSSGLGIIDRAVEAAFGQRMRSTEERINILKESLKQDLDVQRVALDTMIRQYEKSTDSKDKESLLGRIVAAAQGLTLEGIKSLPQVLEIDQIRRQVTEDAQKAERSYENAKRETLRLLAELESMKIEDPYSSIFLKGQKAADDLQDKIKEIDQSIENVTKDLNASAAGSERRGKYAATLAALQGEKAELEKQKDTQGKITNEEHAIKNSELNLYYVNLATEADRGLLDVRKKRLDIEKELGRISPLKAAEEEIRLHEESIDLQINELEIQKAQAAEREQHGKWHELDIKIKKLTDERLTQEGKLLKYYAAQNDELSKQKAILDFRDLMGRDVERDKEALEIQERITKAVQNNTIPDIQGAEAWVEWYKMMNGDGTLKGDFEAMGKNFSFGFDRALLRATDVMFQIRQLGEGTANALKNSFSDFAFSFATGAESINDAAKSLFKNIFQSFTRMLSDMWAEYMIVMLKMFARKLFFAIAGGATGTMMGGDVASLAGSAHTGGLITASGIKKFHSGGLATDERLAVLQTGEAVISRRGVNALNALNQGRVAQVTPQKQQAPVNNFYIMAADAKSFADMVRRNPSAILGTVQKDLSVAGSTRDSVRRYV